MSQKKVDAYKQQKANRDKIMKREKRLLFLEKTAAVLVCAAVIGWIGFSVYGKINADQEQVKTETVMDTSALDQYIAGLSEETAE